jgi:A/G-specific adenine glycosylase
MSSDQRHEHLLAARLLSWFRNHARDLPWRHTRDPYAIWLSEVMLQQTQVTTVLPYYQRFLARFPDIATLAAAPLDDVLKSWEGLGYYARARRLHQAARELAASAAAQMPRQYEQLLALPGIGRSTAGAIASLAYGEVYPLLDGNVRRVLCRLDAIGDDPRRAATLHALWRRSTALVTAASDPASFNQALMELGATCCRPRQPSCEHCPWQTACLAYQRGLQQQLPLRSARRSLPHHQVGVGLLLHEGRVLVQQRPAEGLLGGLWEFPGGKQLPEETLPTTVRRELAEELAIDVAVGAKLAVVQHAYSHFKVTLHAYACHLVEGAPVARAATALRWVTLTELDQLAMPGANRRLLALIDRTSLATSQPLHAAEPSCRPWVS